MSGKRSLKKQQKRQAAALAELEALVRRGTPSADDDLLARVAEQGIDVAASPFAAQWAEVADRAVRQSLARADLGRLDRLLRPLRRTGPLRPLAILARAVLDLAADRLAEARAGLAALAGAAGGIPAVPPSLLTDLQALAQNGLDRHHQDPYPQAAADLFASLQTLGAQGCAPTEADRQTLACRLRTLRDLAPVETPEDLKLHRLLDGADRCLALLAELAPSPLEQVKAQTRQALGVGFHRTGPALQAALGASMPPLFAPLQQAVAARWRGFLEQVVVRQGGAGLTALWTADPRLLAPHVDLPRGGGQESLRQRTQAQRLLERQRYVQLADLLRSRSRTVTAAADLAALWSLELWARGRWDDEPDDEDGGYLTSGRDEPVPHRTLVRLGEMAEELGRRLPPEQRAGVARVLAGELFDLSVEVGFCDHTAAAALSLLEHPPGEPIGIGLLLAGLAGAIAADARQAVRALLAHLDRSRKGTAEPSPIARRLLALIAAREDPRALALLLDAVRPLFSTEAWPEIAEIVAREMGGSFAEILDQVSFSARGNPTLGHRRLGEARKTLDRLRPTLAGTLGFAAVELVLDCWGAAGPAVEERLARFLAASPGWDGALTAFEVLEDASGSGSPAGLDRAAGSLARAVIDRLDDRWQLWCPAVPGLAFAADRARLKLLEKRVRQLLASPEVQGDDRESLTLGLQAIHHAKSLRHETDRPRQRAKGAKPKKKSRRRSGNPPQLGLDFP